MAVVAVLGLGLPASAATVSGSDEMELLRLHNQYRAENGRAAMADDIAARDVARDWARTIADRGTLSHNPNLADQVSRRVTAQWTRIGENVGRAGNAASVFQAFVNSTAHRNNILGDFNRVGVGAARDARGQLWVAIVFVKGPALPVVPAATWSPFATPYALVEQQYRDFLARTGDSGGVEHWATQLRAGRASAPAEIEWFMGSPEFGALIAPIVRLYFGAYGRAPDYPGIQAWLAEAQRGRSAESVADAFAASTEFRNRYGSLSNRQYVDALYRAMFGRAADAGALNHWGGGLDAGRFTRGQVLNGLAQSGEYVGASRSEVQVTMTYVGMLRRAPDSAGFRYWVGEVDRGRSVTHLIGGFLSSQEYHRRING